VIELWLKDFKFLQLPSHSFSSLHLFIGTNKPRFFDHCHIYYDWTISHIINLTISLPATSLSVSLQVTLNAWLYFSSSADHETIIYIKRNALNFAINFKTKIYSKRMIQLAACALNAKKIFKPSWIWKELTEFY